MDKLTIAFGIVSALASACAIIFGVLAAKRNDNTDARSEGKSEGMIMNELGYIKSGIDDVKRKQDKQDDQNMEFNGRLSAVEQSAKQAHHRIDNIDSKLNGG